MAGRTSHHASGKKNHANANTEYENTRQIQIPKPKTQYLRETGTTLPHLTEGLKGCSIRPTERERKRERERGTHSVLSTALLV